MVKDENAATTTAATKSVGAVSTPKVHHELFIIRQVIHMPATSNAKARYEVWVGRERGSNVEDTILVYEKLAQRTGLDSISAEQLADRSNPVILSCKYEQRIAGVTGYKDKDGAPKFHTSTHLAATNCSLVARQYSVQEEVMLKAGKLFKIPQEVEEMAD